MLRALSCPIRRYANAFRLIGIGLSVWTLAVACCGLALGFWTLVLCRMLVGVGEASFVALASPFIGARNFVNKEMLIRHFNQIA